MYVTQKPNQVSAPLLCRAKFTPPYHSQSPPVAYCIYLIHIAGLVHTSLHIEVVEVVVDFVVVPKQMVVICM